MHKMDVIQLLMTLYLINRHNKKNSHFLVFIEDSVSISFGGYGMDPFIA